MHNIVNKILKYIKCFIYIIATVGCMSLTSDVWRSVNQNSLRTSAMYTNWSLFVSPHRVY